MREKVLKELYQNKNGYLSGEELAERLGVSRTAIWKHINSLKEEGYVIDTVRKKGYLLKEKEDKLIPIQIKNQIKTREIGHNIIYLNSVDSTNNYAKQIAQSATHGTVIISDEQTGGRGRLGRSWAAPKGEGIFMSMILKPHIPPTEGAKLTQIAAAAVCLGIRSQTALAPLIKWPNDIVLNGKKICGILTEMVGELNAIDYLVVGIGVNVNMTCFDEGIRAVATSLFIEGGQIVQRSKLIQSILEIFERLYLEFIETGKLDETVGICRTYSALLGKSVRVIRGKQEFSAMALDITPEGLLKVSFQEGKEEVLLSGEVSVRGESGYI